MNQCPSCHNQFLQPFVCTTCGAEKLYDATLTSLQDRLRVVEAQRDSLLSVAEDLVRQITEFAEEYGEASFFTGNAKAAIDAARGKDEQD